MKIAVIDVETTGLNPVADRITEIGIVFIEDEKITDKFENLINPESLIPTKIVQLTGINNTMVKDQPIFGELARKIIEITEDHILVGHHINFDYSFLKNEMTLAGFSYSRKTLCTFDLSRYLLSNLNSHSLSSLTRYYKINNRKPHRALPDAEATAEVFLRLVKDSKAGFLENLLQDSKKSSLVPEHLKLLVYKQIPKTPGVYYFVGKGGKPVYIGKAANLRNRVISHFRGVGNSLQILALGEQIKHITYQESGNEMMASLLEDHEIRHQWPVLNRAQKKPNIRFGIVSYMDQKGRWRMSIAKSGKAHFFIASFHQYHLAADFVRSKVMEYGLDGSLCGLQDHSPIDLAIHNINFARMHKKLTEEKKVKCFMEGRNDREKSFIWIENDTYKGFGFIENENQSDPAVLLQKLTLRYSSITSEGIIRNLRESEKPELILDIKKPPINGGSNLQT